mgnify:CR=1 FL=1
MTLTYRIDPPKRDLDAIKFFFENLSEFLKYKDVILKSKKLYFMVIFGAGTSGLYIGDKMAFLGDLVQLYDDGGAWKINRNGKTFYLFHASGSPLSGGNVCFGWNDEKMKTATFSIDRFMNALEPLGRLHSEKNMPVFSEDVDIPVEMKLLYNKLTDYAVAFRKKLEAAGVKPYPNKAFEFTNE